GYLPTHSQWKAFSDGFEIASTGGVSETLQQTGFSVTLVDGSGNAGTPTTTSVAPANRTATAAGSVAVPEIGVSRVRVSGPAVARVGATVSYSLSLTGKKGEPKPTGRASITQTRIVKVTGKVKGKIVTKSQTKTITLATGRLSRGTVKLALNASRVGVGP